MAHDIWPTKWPHACASIPTQSPSSSHFHIHLLAPFPTPVIKTPPPPKGTCECDPQSQCVIHRQWPSWLNRCYTTSVVAERGPSISPWPVCQCPVKYKPFIQPAGSKPSWSKHTCILTQSQYTQCQHMSTCMLLDPSQRFSPLPCGQPTVSAPLALFHCYSYESSFCFLLGIEKHMLHNRSNFFLFSAYRDCDSPTVALTNFVSFTENA